MRWLCFAALLAGCTDDVEEADAEDAAADVTLADVAVDAGPVVDAEADAAVVPPDALAPDGPPPPPPQPILNEVDCRDDDGVELLNRGPTGDLAGWTVAGTPLEGSIEAGAFAWFPTGRIVCEDAVTLVAPDGTVVDEVTPPLGVESATYGRFPDGEAWTATAPTPGAPNRLLVGAADELFDGTVRQIDLAVSEAAWAVLVQTPRERVDVSVTVEDDQPAFGKVHVTGRSGRFKPITNKPSMTLHFEQPFYGLRALELDALTLDAGVVTRRVAQRLVPWLPRVGWAWVRLNGVDYGFYAVAEVRDADFLARGFVSTRHLFAATGRDVVPGDVWRFEAEVGPDQRPELERLAAVGDEMFYAESQDFVAWDAVAMTLAAEVAIGSVDGYGPARQAVWLHFDALGRLSLLPGGVDHALRTAVPALRGPSRLLQRCLADAECLGEYLTWLRVAAGWLDADAGLEADVAAVREWVARDPRSLSSVEMFDLEVERIRAFLAGRAAQLRAFVDCVAEGGEGCEDGSGPNCAGRPDDDAECFRCVELSRGGATYHACPTPVPYADAVALCERLGAQLAITDSAGEAQWLNRHARAVSNRDYWIGLDDLAEEGAFAWPDGRERAFTYWQDGQPDNAGDGEDCAHLRGNGRWNDRPCGDRLGVLCEAPCADPEADADADGATACGVDCDEGDPEVYPGATDVCGDGLDQDCDGAADNRDCACTAVERDGRRYLLCQENLNFDEGRALCQAHGMDLAIVDDAAENLWLYTEALRRQPKRWWIGISDTVVEGEYRWWDGSKPRFHAWTRGEPNDAGRREDCGHFWENRPGWNDIPCDARHGSICEEIDGE